MLRSFWCVSQSWVCFCFRNFTDFLLHHFHRNFTPPPSFTSFLFPILLIATLFSLSYIHYNHASTRNLSPPSNLASKMTPSSMSLKWCCKLLQPMKRWGEYFSYYIGYLDYYLRWELFFQRCDMIPHHIHSYDKLMTNLKYTSLHLGWTYQSKSWPIVYGYLCDI